jgi:hypothetical protein
MSGVLYNRGKQTRSQGSFKNELQECLGIIERLREPDIPFDCEGDEIFLYGSVNLESVNRMRRVCGMKELPPACPNCKAGTLRMCICDPMNGEG